MTKQQKLMQQPRIKNTYHFLERGMVDLIEATEAIIKGYKDGVLDYGSACEAIRLLSKVKTQR